MSHVPSCSPCMSAPVCAACVSQCTWHFCAAGVALAEQLPHALNTHYLIAAHQSCHITPAHCPATRRHPSAQRHLLLRPRSAVLLPHQRAAQQQQVAGALRRHGRPPGHVHRHSAADDGGAGGGMAAEAAAMAVACNHMATSCSRQLARQDVIVLLTWEHMLASPARRSKRYYNCCIYGT